MTQSYLTFVKCLQCNHQFGYEAGNAGCPVCGGAWLEALYNYEAVAALWRMGVPRPVNSLWRYAELLPPVNLANCVSMGEGNTPLVRAGKIQRRLGHPAIFIKDERQSPTSSFKDRQAAVAVSIMQEAGIKECVLASTGNAAAAYAAYCARADIKLWIFVTSLVPSGKMREMALYGAEVIKVTGTYDQAKQVAADFADRRRIYFDKGAKTVPGKESMKTVAFEIAEQLAGCYNADLPNSSGPWRAPDWYIQAVSGGIGPLGVLKGFEELHHMGLINKVPKIGVIQVEGCAPMVRAFAAGLPKASPVVPETHITVLSTGDPGMGYELLYQAAQKYGGHMLAVRDEEAFESMRLLARTEGFSVEPATAVAFAGLDKLVQANIIGPAETVVINCSGHTFPAEKYIIDDEQVLSLRLAQTDRIRPGAPVEGLGAALQRLDEQVTTIVIIDDNPVDSRLISRLLQTRRNYRVFEANSAPEGLKLVQERLPDLVITDLTMPDMDGFTLLEALKQDPRTAAIPVTVVSAKDLTEAEKQILQANNVTSLWQKGQMDRQELVAHVESQLGC
jgi:threonine synthase